MNSFLLEWQPACQCVHFGFPAEYAPASDVGTRKELLQAFLFPGIGYGGSCFPKDVQALVHSARTVSYRFGILEAVEAVNRRQKKRLFKKMQEVLGSLNGKQIAIWGLAFKPRTDDMREAPSIVMIEALLEAGAKVVAYDPQAKKSGRAIFGERVAFSSDSYDALRKADALGILTEWNEFREPDFERMRRLMMSPVIFDGRNLFDSEQMEVHGFRYYSIGR